MNIPRYIITLFLIPLFVLVNCAGHASADWLDEWEDNSDKLRSPRHPFIKPWGKIEPDKDFEAKKQKPRRKLFVSPSGNDVSGDGTALQPWRSIKRGIVGMSAGDTLFLMEGVYREYVDFERSGSPRAYLSIEALPGAKWEAGSQESRDAVFETNGRHYIRFRKFRINGARAGVEINRGSHHIIVDGLEAMNCGVAVWMTGAHQVVIKDSAAVDCVQGFKGEGNTYDISLRNVSSEIRHPRKGDLGEEYFDRDGFFFDMGTHHISLSRVRAAHHEDAGLDLMGNAVSVEYAIVYGNSHGIKTWGNNISIKNSLAHNNRSRLSPAGFMVGGTGIYVVRGAAVIEECTVADNTLYDLRTRKGTFAEIRNTIVARRFAEGELLEARGRIESDRVLWYVKGADESRVQMGENDLWADPLFAAWETGDYHLAQGSPAVDAGADEGEFFNEDLDRKQRINGMKIDLGCYEKSGNPVNGLAE